MQDKRGAKSILTTKITEDTKGKIEPQRLRGTEEG